MKKLLVLLAFIVSSNVSAMITTRHLIMDNVEIGAGLTATSRVLSVAKGNEYAIQITSPVAAAGSVSPYISVDCQNYEILSEAVNNFTGTSNVLVITNAGYPCVRFDITNSGGTNNFTIIATVKERS